ncbi:MAG: class E sortase [Streptosporangiaceae bacterium]
MVRALSRGFGEVCLTVGVILLLYIAYLLWGTAWAASNAQHSLASQLNRAWAHQDSPSNRPGPSAGSIHLVTGVPFAFIRVPAFGKNWRFTIVQGTTLAQLNVSPGHVPGTQLPGQIGNFAVAGHRVTAGNPFWSEPSLRNGDLIYIETGADDYTYKVTGKQTVLPTNLTVLDPVPGHPGQRPARRMITLITCNPAWTGTHRVVVTGILVSAQPKVTTISHDVAGSVG